MCEAKEIADDLLARTGAALKSGDFDQFQACFSLPQRVSSNLGTQVLTTLDEMRETFDRVRWHLRAQRATHLARATLAAMFVDDETVVYVHSSRVLRNGVDVQTPFKAISTARRIDGEWRVADCAYAIPDSLRHNRALYGPREPQAAAG